MRYRFFARPVAALLGVIGVAGLALAQQPAALPMVPVPQAPAAMAAQPIVPPAGMVAVPMVQVAPVMVPAPPIVVQGQPGCGATAAAPAACAPAASAACDSGSKGGSLIGRLFIGKGTASPVGCSCLAAERTFVFGSCNQFFTPGKTCFGGTREYGCGSGECGGGLTAKDNCKHVTSFHNR